MNKKFMILFFFFFFFFSNFLISYFQRSIWQVEVDIEASSEAISSLLESLRSKFMCSAI
ncbi:hypothetical protein Hanom_Chr03g00269361 [Helianthus anomalus]